MDAIELIVECHSLGARFNVENGVLHVMAPKQLPDNLRAELRAHKQQVIMCLNAARPSACSNPFTPHETHEYPWECDPNTCYCYRVYGYPRYCQGVPCRWVWPSKNTTH
jgi:hypothetical protein